MPLSAFSEPQTLLSHKINLMPLGIFLRLCLPWRLCSCSCSHILSTLRPALPRLPAPLPTWGSLCARSWKLSLFFCRNSLGLCQGQKTKPDGFCNYPVWHLLSSDPPRCLRGAGTRGPVGVKAGGNQSMAELLPRYLNWVQLHWPAEPGQHRETCWSCRGLGKLLIPSELPPLTHMQILRKPQPLSLA